MEIDVEDVTERSRYEVRVDGELAGFADYRKDAEGRVVLPHVEVDPAFGGKGVGTQLAEAVFEDLREQRVEVLARCPFMVDYLRKHPDALG